MNDQLLPDIELQELRLRWEVAPTPKLALQLAEEYRRRNRHQQGIEVLEEAVRSHPGHLAPRVALGRFHLELEHLQEASRLLEGVLEEDPTHLVASKLLVDLYLETGEEHKARDLLDLYRLLNESDPEIESLEQRFRVETAAVEEVLADEPVGEETAVASPGVEVAEDTSTLAETTVEDPLPLPPVESEIPDLARVEPPPSAVVDERLAAEPFQGIWDGVGGERYWSLLGAEGIFPLQEAVPQAVEAAAEASPVEAIAVEDEVEERAAPSVWEAEPESAVVEPPPTPATVTLAELYFEQGHLVEAEQAFEDVLARDPENAVAQRRLSEIRSKGASGLTAEELLADVDPQVGVRQRKIRLLKSYLGRIRANVEARGA